MDNSTSKKIKVIITGRVQGVFYRASTQEMALKIGLTGYVKNLSDGSVEALFIGSEDQLNKAVNWCKQGPPSAIVENVSVSEFQTEDKYNSFLITK